MPKITINGEEVEVKPGATIIEAFKQDDQDICHYCWHPGLSVAGVCRLCMVEIEGNPRLQIACNTAVQDGMVVTNESEKVKEAAKWGLDFHLINHPLDCPICDQAGECGLQDQYMKFGRYTPEMAEKRVFKRKVLDLGPTVTLDSERCVLCSRCVRFTNEVTETNELGIFQRGDSSEVGIVEGQPLDNDYSLNVVDICPVGALTSKDFRFKQRVWYLEEAETICTGCATGCSVKVSYNKDGAFRIKPVYNESVNGYWMCDAGRTNYKWLNRSERLLTAKKKSGESWVDLEAGAAAKDVASFLTGSDASKVALVLTGQNTSEEYEAILDLVTKDLGSKNVYHWVNNRESFEEFDGMLKRGDLNPNTKGLLGALNKRSLNSTWEELFQKVNSGELETVIVVGPENVAAYADQPDVVKRLGAVKNLVWLSSAPVVELDSISSSVWNIPQKTFLEKEGTFVNYKGLVQKIERGTTFVTGALSLQDTAVLMSGKELEVDLSQIYTKHVKKNYFTAKRGEL